MLYQKTKDILLVKSKLGHKDLKNTTIYTYLVNFEADEYTSRVAAMIEEAQELVEAAFEYVCDF